MVPTAADALVIVKLSFIRQHFALYPHIGTLLPLQYTEGSEGTPHCTYDDKKPMVIASSTCGLWQ